MVALGQIPDQTLGFEASGVVRRIGSGVSRFKPGDAVCAMSPGAQRTRLRANQFLCQHIPGSLSFAEAATVSVVHCTAYHALV
jgi:NADPH:quinone reductase-like Zn-dependent oxidoreductase